MDSTIAVIGKDGWKAPTNPPDDDRVVQIAWDDMSYGRYTFGVFDSGVEDPNCFNRSWWSMTMGSGVRKIPDKIVGAWRDRKAVE